jgi:hypothetical protein
VHFSDIPCCTVMITAEIPSQKLKNIHLHTDFKLITFQVMIFTVNVSVCLVVPHVSHAIHFTLIHCTYLYSE